MYQREDVSEELRRSQGLRQRISAFPVENIWIATVLGFIAGTLVLFGGVVLGGTWERVSADQFFWFVLRFYGAIFAATAINKHIKGRRWSNQHWFERLLTLLALSGWGLALSAFVFDQILFIRSEGFDYWLKH
jgi:ABC-type phosphate/phosphonate transport system permease subunit